MLKSPPSGRTATPHIEQPEMPNCKPTLRPCLLSALRCAVQERMLGRLARIYEERGLPEDLSHQVGGRCQRERNCCDFSIRNHAGRWAPV